MGCMRCCAIFIPIFAVAFPLLHSLAFNGWVNDYFPPPQWTAEQMPDMAGKVAIVTGPTVNGIGYESCVELAKKGAHVILAGRSKSKGEVALEALKQRVPAAKAEFMTLDLGSLQSVKNFTIAFSQKGLGLHILLNSAGVMANPFTLTVDGIESQFGTNHLGHFLLTKLLLPILEKSAPSRVVTVSSAAAFIPDGFPPIVPADDFGLNFTAIQADSEPLYSPFSAYGRSKFANVLFASGLDRRLAGKKIYSNSCHPGGIKTNLGRHVEVEITKKAGEIFKAVFQRYMDDFVLMTASQGAVTQLYLATAPEIETKSIRGHLAQALWVGKQMLGIWKSARYLRFTRKLCNMSGKPKIRVEVVTDVVWPWCYIGEEKLKKAVVTAQDKLGIDVSVSHTAFMLRPDYPKEGVDKFEFFKQKFGGAQRANEFFSRIISAAKEEGLQYAPLEGLKTGNSSDAHRLVLWARKMGKEDDMLTEIYKAYNCAGKWVGDHDVLIGAVTAAGLSASDAQQVLADPSICAEELQESLSRSQQLGVQGVPAYFVEGRFAGSGAQPTEAFLRAFQQIKPQREQ